jgi:transposase-like protein
LADIKKQNSKHKTSCPRCNHSDVRIEFKGKENRKTVWTILYCNKCCFGWRDTEPETTIVNEKRKKSFQIDFNHIDKFPAILR